MYECSIMESLADNSYWKPTAGINMAVMTRFYNRILYMNLKSLHFQVSLQNTEPP